MNKVLTVLLLGGVGIAQISQEAYNIEMAKAHAKNAIPELRMMMKDPGSFTLIQVIAIVKPNKKDATKPSFRGVGNATNARRCRAPRMDGEGGGCYLSPGNMLVRPTTDD